MLGTTFDRSNARQLGGLPVERVVWLDDPAPSLAHAITDVLAVPLRYRIGESILRSGKVSGRVYDALRAMLCGSGRPARTTDGLARFLRCSKSSLERDWRAQVLPATGLHVSEMPQWVLLLEVHERKARGTSWNSAAKLAGVSYRKLRNAAIDVAGLDLDELASSSEHDLNLRFAGTVTRLLTTLRALPDDATRDGATADPD